MAQKVAFSVGVPGCRTPPGPATIAPLFFHCSAIRKSSSDLSLFPQRLLEEEKISYLFKKVDRSPFTAALLAPAMLMMADTTDPSYWLNWKFLLCATWVYSCMALACYLIWKYEGPSSPAGNDDAEEAQQARIGPGVVYLEDCWKPCLKQIHPAWLLAFRLVSFFVMASILTYDVVVDGWTVFLYYTQWTFLLVTLYFGLGSVLSVYGCYQQAYKTGGDTSDADHGSYIIAPTGESGYDNSIKTSFSKTHDGREIAGFWGYVFQIMFQTNAGAVLITDLVFWFILYPFLARNQYDMNFLLIGTHSINVVFIIGDTALNSLRFPWFRIAYFMLWTGMFVTVQWIVHANVSIWWPYPFLDLTYPGAPIWYLVVALLHLPCYGLFALVLRLKQSLLQKWFSDSYTYVK